MGDESAQPFAPLVGRPLTAQELHIAALTAEGLTAQQVADNLGITLGTVNQKRHDIRRKLGVKTGGNLRAALIARFGSGTLSPLEQDQPEGSDKRVYLALRHAISSVDELRLRLEARAAAVRRAATNIAGGLDLAWEAAEIEKLAADLAQAHQRAVASARAPRT
ncbi:MAG TPA: helix-turn-helix transcriptional regulator [Acidimicrobiales bacterium]|nr:helix-turn-helix transcriptional regulator [Acidimicrobiales bacterium]